MWRKKSSKVLSFLHFSSGVGSVLKLECECTQFCALSAGTTGGWANGGHQENRYGRQLFCNLSQPATAPFFNASS
jgi:hypothetical protein